MSQPQLRFDDDVAIVTGAGRGLGREHALLLAQRGAAVLVNDIDPGEAAAVVAEIVDGGGRAVANSDDVSQPSGAQAIVAHAVASFGKLTILINNAGVIDFAPLAEITDSQWRRMMSVTLDGAFYMCRAAWTALVEAGGGAIINTTSNAGFAGNELLVHYGAAKLAVAGLTKALAQEGKPLGIRVNAVAPMAVTRMNRDHFFGGASVEGPDWRDDIRGGKVPMGPPSAVAPTVAWLAHRDTPVNGQIYSSSSGKVARVGFVIGEGWFDPHHTPEDLAEHEVQIDSLESFCDPQSTGDELALIPPLFTERD
nr:SDR family NAD(P)-dependent oxidoreductase [uncultured Sphingomonas sp.]